MDGHLYVVLGISILAEISAEEAKICPEVWKESRGVAPDSCGPRATADFSPPTSSQDEEQPRQLPPHRAEIIKADGRIQNCRSKGIARTFRQHAALSASVAETKRTLSVSLLAESFRYDRLSQAQSTKRVLRLSSSLRLSTEGSPPICKIRIASRPPTIRSRPLQRRTEGSLDLCSLGPLSYRITDAIYTFSRVDARSASDREQDTRPRTIKTARHYCTH